MAKLYKIKKSYAYLKDGVKTYVRKFKRNSEGLLVLDQLGFKQDNIVSLTGEAFKVGKKCKAIEAYDEELEE